MHKDRFLGVGAPQPCAPPGPGPSLCEPRIPAPPRSPRPLPEHPGSRALRPPHPGEPTHPLPVRPRPRPRPGQHRGRREAAGTSPRKGPAASPMGEGAERPPPGTEMAVMMEAGPSPQPTPWPRTLRGLAVASIVCGCSCLGALALVYAVKANEKRKAKAPDAALWARRSLRLSLLSIGLWVFLLLLLPLLIYLVSYLLARAE